MARITVAERPRPKTEDLGPKVLARSARQFWENVEFTGDCWNWTGEVDHVGYGRFFMMVDGRAYQLAHRITYRLLAGDPTGWEIDHLCRDRLCVNPDHFDLVTHAVNTRRGFSPPGLSARRTHCRHGHAYTEENTALRSWKGRPHRVCRICEREIGARYRQRRSERAA